MTIIIIIMQTQAKIYLFPIEIDIFFSNARSLPLIPKFGTLLKIKIISLRLSV